MFGEDSGAKIWFASWYLLDILRLMKCVGLGIATEINNLSRGRW